MTSIAEKASRAEGRPPVAADRAADTVAPTCDVTTTTDARADSWAVAKELVWNHALTESLAACVREYDPSHKLAAPEMWFAGIIAAALSGHLASAEPPDEFFLSDEATATLLRHRGCAEELTWMIVAAGRRVECSWDKAEGVACAFPPEAKRRPFKLVTTLTTGAKRPPRKLANGALPETFRRTAALRLCRETLIVEGGPGSGKTTLAVALAAGFRTPAAVYHSVGADAGSRADAMLKELLQKRAAPKGETVEERMKPAVIQFVCEVVKEAVPKAYRNSHHVRPPSRDGGDEPGAHDPERRPPFVLILDDVDHATHKTFVDRLIRYRDCVYVAVRRLVGLDRDTPVVLIIAGSGCKPVNRDTPRWDRGFQLFEATRK